MANQDDNTASITDIDTHDVNSVAGATYFVVGRGTEGGASSFHLSIAGVTVNKSEPDWGDVDSVRDNSGYSLGTIQVDFGQRGTWALGAVAGRPLKPGETTYVDAVVDQAAKYAQAHGLAFTQDKAKLREDLLSHGDGQRFIGEGKNRKADPRTPLVYIDEDTRDSINAWASSSEGQQWIHKNIDFPQVKNATQSAMDLLDKYGENISADRRLETIAILAKTENQMPSQLRKLERVLKDGGDYDDVLAKANEIKNRYSAYDGPKAAAIAENYKNAYQDPEKAAALDRAQTKVSDANFDPSKSANDPDINAALKAIHPGRRQHGVKSPDADVSELQTKLAQLGYTGSNDKPLVADGHMGDNTRHAIKAFQHDHHLKEDGVAGPATLRAINAKLTEQALIPRSQQDPQLQDNPLFKQAQSALQRVDAQFGRTPDQLTDNAAGAVAVSAHRAGLTRIDHIELGGVDNSKIFAVQGKLGTAHSKVIDVPTVDAMHTPIAQSDKAFAQAQQHSSATQQAPQVTPPTPQQAAPEFSR
ncbi:peptidoglycan-binding domain-containing protein [Acidovorax sp. CCYZU-2555]|uniref:peptidoglycan-binding domain-containing protein n=1 Tax=Acidovorax sp. CCYZU-2555 TaxID=2835042 RepID=UPI001BCBB6A8|nr:peptidoglycan-binding domain-containing protein [Acidovorax sp. CCYZU-2555]MBS7777350.1 peptidoglycan-binding protein [Acidovorax sp. CCYZU-2555]